MRAELTTYAVPGWGVGELWTGEGIVLAHEFRFGTVRDTTPSQLDAAAPLGAQSPPSSTVSTNFERVGDGFVPTSQQHDASSTNGRPATSGRDGSLAPDAIVRRFEAFFAGEDADLRGVPIDLAWTTPFQRALAETLRTIPRGEVVSYGELAALAGRPGAARAAGSFCAGNRFMLIVPCHRVVGAAGIGGYGAAGVAAKRRLLALEGVVL